MSLSATFLRRATQKPGEVSVEGDTEKDSFRGLPVVIENRKGTIREGTDPSGHEWSITMQCDYGYVPSTEAAGDKEGLDVFIGDDQSSEYAYAVEQLKEDGSFDEYKVVLGAPDLETAEKLYLSNYEDGWGDKHIAEIWEIPLRQLFDGIKDNQAEVGTEKNASKKGSVIPAVVTEFLNSYDFEFYEQVAEEVHEFLEDLLQVAGVRALVTSRAKRVKSLRDKLTRRYNKSVYEDLAAIQQDIKDLAGVRIALYFPQDQDKVRQIIDANFQSAREPKLFPRDADPEDGQGYSAVHYTVWWEGTVVEVQVASILMHAFAEVNHDLGYKPQLGALSNAEIQIIESLGALMLQGDSTIDQLQGEIERRTGNPLSFAVVSALRNRMAAARYHFVAAEEIDVTPKKKSRFEKLCERQGMTTDAMDDKLKALWKEQGIVAPPPPPESDAPYIAQALSEIVPGKQVRCGDLPADLQTKVYARAQELKIQGQKI